ncbi:MAG: prepilin-type N-terminal cleavage/methylation domain-containing protein [Candidatus Moranbacteria bacterium]|jgi:prepilin-type N-terminal cleavage/methylation domain-containing protein|nr:prepilin-type N-terminal cleavage/methylation domain-containing protein [Candidatus Moranbacteria bacterium]MDX9855370.1 prepilin-type N-terminal cleavage/methylation domain-containing protein [Candidatus Moranbacteria bacterium]
MRAILFKTKKGMSLTELLVAMFIFTVVSMGISIFFANIWKSKYNELEMGKSLLIASQAVNNMKKSIRQAGQADSGAYLISSASNFDFVFYSDIDNDNDMEKIRYYLDGSEIKMEKAEPILGTNPTYPDVYEAPVTIAKDIANTETEPIFSYFDNDYDSLATPTSAYPIRLIKITLYVNTDPNKISDVSISSLVYIRNVNN